MSKIRKQLKVVRWNEQDIVNALAKRYSDPEWAFFPQVRNTTGLTWSPRTADAVAMNLWPSRGLEVHGFEVKTRRSDWLNELKNPEKADSIAKYCDRWWLAVAGGYGEERAESIVRPGELPAAWGLLSMHGGQLRCDKEASKLDAIPLDRHFVAALLRNQAVCPAKEMQEKYEEGVTYGKECAGSEYNRLKEDVEKFEAASGVSIKDVWSLGEVGKAVKVLTNMRFDVTHIRKSAESAQAIADALRSMVDASGLGPLGDEIKAE